jgi:hypothetical protein
MQVPFTQVNPGGQVGQPAGCGAAVQVPSTNVKPGGHDWVFTPAPEPTNVFLSSATKPLVEMVTTFPVVLTSTLELPDFISTLSVAPLTEVAT